MSSQTFHFAVKYCLLFSFIALSFCELPAQKVFFYDGKNFSGKSKSFGVGTFELKSKDDLNNLISSVKIPKDYVLLAHDLPPGTGKSASIDLVKDAPDLSVLKFDNKISHISIFYALRGDHIWEPGYLNTMGEWVPGHWERKTQGHGPTDDLKYTGVPTQEELDRFQRVKTNQMGVAVLAGETTKAFYFHHNDENERTYKYDKVIDYSKLPKEGIARLEDAMGKAGVFMKPLEASLEVVGAVKDWIFGNKNTLTSMDCWFPTSEYKQTVCGRLKEHAYICPQDFAHTELTIDQDVNLNITISPAFADFKKNRWLDDSHSSIEGEVFPAMLTGSLKPKNPAFLKPTENKEVCFFGPWMGDVLDVEVLGKNIDLRQHNEIHPMNQIWYRDNSETTLIAAVDGTGYFDKKGNGEIAASGLGQRMTFHVAFEIPASLMRDSMTSKKITYHVNSVGFDYTDKPGDAVKKTVSLQYKGKEKIAFVFNTLSVGDNFTWKFDEIRLRDDGSIQGYLMLETSAITQSGGSINLFVKRIDP